MELLEMVTWVLLGFIPTYGVLEAVSRRLSKAKRSLMEVYIEGKKEVIK